MAVARSKRKVAYFYDSEFGNYHYGAGHPMKVSGSILLFKRRSPL